eukprot:3312094-Pyramimonas_sp.AAC.1
MTSTFLSKLRPTASAATFRAPTAARRMPRPFASPPGRKRDMMYLADPLRLMTCGCRAQAPFYT